MSKLNAKQFLDPRNWFLHRNINWLEAKIELTEQELDAYKYNLEQYREKLRRMDNDKLEPFKQIIIQDLFQENFDNFMHYSVACETRWILWVDGMILDAARYDGGAEELKKALDGIEIYKRVTFVKFPKYTRMLKWNSGGLYEIPLLNWTSSQKYSSIAKWVKTQPIWNESPKHEELNLQIQEKYR